jgi:hypothetical protein
MAKQELCVHLRVYRGQTLTYDVNGKSTNENNLIKLFYDTMEYKRFLAHLKPNGYLKAEVENVVDLTQINEGKVKEDKDYYKSIENWDFISQEIEKAMNQTEAVSETSEQKQIRELTERLDAMTNPKKETKVVDVVLDAPLEDTEFENLKAEYLEKSGKKVHHLWQKARVIEEIEKLK